MPSAMSHRRMLIACVFAVFSCGVIAHADTPQSSPKDDKKPAPKKEEPTWQSIYDVTGELTLKTKAANVKPRTSRWRLSIATERIEDKIGGKPNQDHSSVQLSLWIEDQDSQGHKILRPMNAKFKKKGGASFVEVYDNGLKDDGTPNTFQVGLSGTLVKYEILVEDLGPAPEDQAKADKPKGKK